MSDKINEFERMVSGKLYNADDSELAMIHTKTMTLCQRFNSIPFDKEVEKNAAKEELIPSCLDKNLGIFTPFYCEYGINIHVGKFCFINYNCTFLDVAPITIGDGVWFGPNVTLATPSHPFIAEERLPNEYPDGFHDLEYANPIVIQDNCWICASSTIIGGVTIGKGSIVAAGAVVTKDVPPNCIVAGVPAKVVREIDEGDRMNVWNTYKTNSVPLSQREKNKL